PTRRDREHVWGGDRRAGPAVPLARHGLLSRIPRRTARRSARLRPPGSDVAISPQGVRRCMIAAAATLGCHNARETGGDRRCAMDRPKSDLFDDPTDTVDGELLHDFTLVRRGYDPEEVNDHLRQLSVRTDALERQLRDAEAQLSAMRCGNDDVWKSAYQTAKDELY